MRNQAKQADNSEYSSHFGNDIDSVDWQKEKYQPQKYQYCIYTVPSVKEKVLRPNRNDS